MINIIFLYISCASKMDWSNITAIVALIVSVIAILVSSKSSRKNTRLSIQQAIFKTVSEKARDCNALWESEPQNERDNELSPHYKIMSELIISKEVIDKSVTLFAENYKSIMKYEDDYYFLFWKQLRTDLRGWIKRTPIIAQQLANNYYTEQVADLHQKLNNHFEPVK
jgi:hypothetical protein